MESNITNFSDKEWPTGYRLEDIAQALMRFPETSAIKEEDRIAKFESLIAVKTGASDTLRLPEPFSKYEYFNRFIQHVNKCKNDYMAEIYTAADLVVNKIKDFVLKITNENPELNKFIQDETTPTRKQMLSDLKSTENIITSFYNMSKENIEIYSDRFNRIKYGLECVVWGTEIDLDVFNLDKTGNTELREKFEFIKKVIAKLDQHDKRYLVDLVRELIRCVVSIFVVRRSNITFDGLKVFKFSFYFKPMKITRLKELVVYDKNPFLLADGNEITEKNEKYAYDKMKKEVDYDRKIDSLFNKYIIDTRRF